jgi:hypothetical protein
MARIESIEFRLLNWARWKAGAGGGRLGYSGLNLANPTPGVRDPYAEAPIPVRDVEASETDQAVQRLPSELKATVIEVYTGRGGEADHLRKLCCAKATMYARIDRAHRLLADHFAAQQDRQREQRERIELLQRQAQRVARGDRADD